MTKVCFVDSKEFICKDNFDLTCPHILKFDILLQTSFQTRKIPVISQQTWIEIARNKK